MNIFIGGSKSIGTLTPKKRCSPVNKKVVVFYENI